MARGHISGQYDTDLETLRNAVLQMGGLVELQLQNACEGLLQRDLTLCDSVRSNERDVNDMEISIDDRCNMLIARRSPAAGDLRLIMTLLKATTDLERVGDEAERVAKMAIQLAELEYPKDQFRAIRPLIKTTREQLRQALDAFARSDVNAARTIIGQDKALDSHFDAVVAEAKAGMRDDSGSVDRWVSLMWTARALERIGDHAKNLCEYLVYLEHGKDIRHSGRDGVRSRSEREATGSASAS
jgi:phosphate transport system protein